MENFFTQDNRLKTAFLGFFLGIIGTLLIPFAFGFLKGYIGYKRYGEFDLYDFSAIVFGGSVGQLSAIFILVMFVF